MPHISTLCGRVLTTRIGVQAASNRTGNLKEVHALTGHPAFSIKNPNCCYSLHLAFARSAVNFHAADGSGYEWLADQVLAVDKVNHQVSARIAGAFTAVKQVDKARQALIQKQLKRMMDAEGLSANVTEILSQTIEV
jgi:aminopeptidase N